jgi:hypothetical protein
VSVGSLAACSLSYVGWLTWHSLSGVGLDDPRLSELYDLSKAAREMRGQLKSSLQQTQIAHKYGSLKDSMRKSGFLVSHVLTFPDASLLKYISRVA